MVVRPSRAVSGSAWNSREYRDGRVRAHIDRVMAAFADPVHALDWRQYRRSSSNLSPPDTAAPPLHELVMLQGRWLLAFRAHAVAAAVGATG